LPFPPGETYLLDMPDPAATLVLDLPFPKFIGVTETEGGALALPGADSLKNHVGTMHAGALFTLGESASGVAMMRTLAPVLGGALPLAKNASIAYQKPAQGRIRAIGTVVEPAEAIAARLAKDGKTTFEIAVKLEDDAGVEVATMTVTWYVRTPR
jgi:acyl-coenzyme A thioesterase PaaI-like protein